MTDEMESEVEDDTLEVEFEGEGYPDTLHCPDGSAHFGGDAQSFLIHWVGKLGFDVTGSALLFSEGGGIGILHPDTGEVLTPKDIAKRAKSGTLKSVQ
jgi:hypothetical protein